MGRKAKASEDSGVKTPAWIVCYSDMVTLLLAFFVLLQSFATQQDPELFRVGQGSFRRAIAGLGIPDLLFGKEKSLEYTYQKKKYTTEECDEISRSRVLDAEEERIKEVFAEMKRMVDTESKDVNRKSKSVILTPIRFEKSGFELNTTSRDYLNDLAMNIRENMEGDFLTVYVVGLAPDVPGGKDKWTIAAKRAHAVEDALRHHLSSMLESGTCEIISWGATGDSYGSAKTTGYSGTNFIRIVIEAEN